MKRGWIALALILTSLVIGGAEYLYTTTAANIYAEMLDSADEHIERNEAYEAQSVAERLDHRFSEDKRILQIFSFHSDVNAITNDLAALRRYAQTGNAADFLALSAQTKRRVAALSELRAPRLSNIL